MSKEQPKPSIADFKKEINKTYTGISYVKMRKLFKQHLEIQKHLETHTQLTSLIVLENAEYETALKPFKKVVILKP